MQPSLLVAVLRMVANLHQVLYQIYQFLNVVASGLVMWKALCLVTNSESPIVVVLSCVAQQFRL